MHFKIGSRRAAALGLAAAAAVSLASASGASASSLTTVRIAYNPNATNTTIVVAEQQGFFKKNGINAKLTASQDTAGLIPSLGKQFDMVNTSPPSLLQAVAAGENLTMVADQNTETQALPNTYLIAAKGITSIKDLVGKTIGVPSLSGTLTEAVVVALNKAGIKKSQVKFLIVPFPDDVGDLASGTIQATDTIVPFNGQLLGAGDVNLGDPLLEVSNNQPAMDIGWASYRPWAHSHIKILKDFIKAENQALAWIKANQTATQAILENNFQLPATAVAHIPLYQYFSFAMKKSYLSDWVAPMKADGDLPKSYKPDYSLLIQPL